MPKYEVEHVVPLTDEQQDELASAITDIHKNLFTTPSLFINVRITDVTKHVTYVSGKRANTNRIIAYVRPGGGRGTEQWNILINKLGEAWKKVVLGGVAVPSTDARYLRATFINATIVAGLEKEFLRPEAGQDKQWLRDNMPAFKKMADGGDAEMAYLVEEVHERGMLNGA